MCIFKGAGKMEAPGHQGDLSHHFSSGGRHWGTEVRQNFFTEVRGGKANSGMRLGG